MVKKINNSFSNDELIKFYEKMFLIRKFEEKAGQLYGAGKIGGFCHLYIGQEAVVIGILSSIKSAKFKSIVQPGDQLLIKARLDKFKMGTCKIISKIYVDNRLITECELLASVVDRDE
mgnify:CR=1 FL=1